MLLLTCQRLLTLARLRMLPLVLLLVLVGYGIAHWEAAVFARRLDALALVLLAWSLLHAGTMWLNASLDATWATCSLATPWRCRGSRRGPGWRCVQRRGGAVGPGVGAAALPAARRLLHPRLAWKGHPVGGPTVNALGYGLLSPMAGWLVAGVAPTARTVALALILVLSTLGIYFLAQLGQGEEDGARGYGTLVARHGDRSVVREAHRTLRAAMGLFVGLAALGMLPRTLLVTAPLLVFLDRRLAGLRRADEVPALLSALVGVATLCVALAVGHYFADLWRVGPVAGQAVPWVPPPLW